ncbi:hypothetical protein HNQ07_002898 [Deinococcus metalli]|uniref:Uncharacterized protein n=1 Tax=Deinococcus metalli TaxID=1141878 RepID=A0A7W8NQ13_9DEIO|nr:hypothetical protein [Deinococcus metalli]MBB5377406.1 hypothetical protein [Deinococcus metalli]GHF50177.1 hypothetical protein GCM10017781_28340 [Deinococcus metalli]
MAASDPHPLDALRDEAQTTLTPDVRAALDTLSAEHAQLLTGTSWAAGAEDALRTAIGMERKAQMEMRIGLGADADALPLRKTTALADMTLPDLLAEARENRVMTLRVLDLLLDTATRRPVRAWTLGEEVPPEVYILSLRNRLRRLGESVAEQRLEG